MKVKKIESSDLFIMNNMDYSLLIELYEMKKSKIRKDSESKKEYINKKIMIKINDDIFSSLSEGMRKIGLLSPLSSESKRSSRRKEEYQKELKIWNKINREIKKGREEGYLIEKDGVKYNFKII